MSQQYKDILTIISRHGPIATSEICEKLSELGYGGAMSWQYFRDSIAKQLCYLRDKGEVTGEDRPQAKGKPLRYWSLIKSEEMASDVAEVQVNDDANWEAFKEAFKDTPIGLETVTPEPVLSEVKAAHKPHLAIAEIMDAYHQEVAEDTDQNFYSFCLGVAYAEKHHGISQ